MDNVGDVFGRQPNLGGLEVGTEHHPLNDVYGYLSKEVRCAAAIFSPCPLGGSNHGRRQLYRGMALAQNTPPANNRLVLFVWFGIMALIFGMGAHNRRPVAADTVQALGLGVAILYLGTFRALGTDSRVWVWALAGLTGDSSGLYWLALYVQAAYTVQTTHATEYTSWLGIVETGAAVVVPPLSGAIISAFPGILEYRFIFVGAALLISSPPKTSLAVETHPQPVQSSTWLRVLWTMASLGLRDGVLFFLPGLYLFLKTESSVWLGGY